MLTTLVAEFGTHWSIIAEQMHGRTDMQCYERWTRCIDPSINHGGWTPEEDALLTTLVDGSETKNWTAIAKQMSGRTAHQCRVRWTKVLDPSIISHKEWTKEDDSLLMKKYKEFGSKWAKIAKFFTGRTDDNVRNRFRIIKHKSIAKKPITKAQNDTDITVKQCTKNENCNLIGSLRNAFLLDQNARSAELKKTEFFVSQ